MLTAQQLLLIAGVIFFVAIACLVYILFKHRTFNIQSIWVLAVKGNTLARVYMLLIGIAFACALLAELLILSRRNI